MIVRQRPFEKTGQGDHPHVDGRRFGILDGLLESLPIRHIAGDDGGGVEVLSVTLL